MALLKLAIRNLRRNQRRTLITLAALVLGVVAMVAMRGFILGFRRMMLENQMLGNIGAVQVHKKGYVANVLGSPLKLDMADSPELRAKLAAVPGVLAVAPRIEFGAQISTPDRRPPPEDGSELPEADRGTSTFLVVTAIDPTVEDKVTPKKWEWVKYGRGAMPSSADDTALVMNEDFSRGLKLPTHVAGTPLPPVEQQLALISPDRDGSLNGENVVLGGTFATMTPNDRRVGWVPLHVAQRLLRMEGHVTEYALGLKPGADEQQVRDLVQAAVGDEYEVHLWKERIPFINDIVEMQDTVFGIASSVLLLVVLLGIINAMLMSVLERVREIGTMLAVGMRRRQIVQLFLTEGLVLGFLGGLVGVVLGTALVLVLNEVGLPMNAPGAVVPSIVRPAVTALFLVRALAQASIGAALAALWPAYRASKLRPVEALAST